MPYEPANTYGGRNGVEEHFINFKQKSQKLDKIQFKKICLFTPFAIEIKLIAFKFPFIHTVSLQAV